MTVIKLATSHHHVFRPQILYSLSLLPRPGAGEGGGEAESTNKGGGGRAQRWDCEQRHVTDSGCKDPDMLSIPELEPTAIKPHALNY